MNEAFVEVMEADSTTLETECKDSETPKNTYFFLKLPKNIAWYEENVAKPYQKLGVPGLIKSLQVLGVLAPEMPCTPPCTNKTECRKARVSDEMQWHCSTCNKNKSLRENTMFKNCFCKLVEIMVVLGAWSEDFEEDYIAEELSLKKQYVSSLYNKLDILVATEYSNTRLGGTDSVVLVELYPSSPPYTDIMLTDTQTVPPKYWLNALTQQQIKTENNNYNGKRLKFKSDEAIVLVLTSVIKAVVDDGASCVIGETASQLEGIAEALEKTHRFTDVKTIKELEPTCPTDLLDFLRERIWRQAQVLCQAAPTCGSDRQRYFNASLYRMRHNTDGFLPILVQLVAKHRTASS